MKNRILKYKMPLLALVTVGLVLSFCVFTNNIGVLRKYIDTDLPFVYQPHNSTPINWLSSIEAGANSWGNEPSIYVELNNGGFTTSQTVTFDGVNLVFFDQQGVNFPPPTNTIAFSSTFTSGSGISYRAVESDLVWNARDFPPGLNGEAGQQDLEGVIAHEFGHHIGMGHTGPIGGPPGCGELIPAATMYGTSASGDTTGRSLERDDVGAAANTYNSWKLQGSVTDATNNQPLDSAIVFSNVVFAGIWIGPPELIPGRSSFQRPGAAVTEVATDPSGNYEGASLLQTYDLTAAKFGYIDSSPATVGFSAPGGIGSTETITQDFALTPLSPADLTVNLTDATTNNPVEGTITVFVESNVPGAPSGVFASGSTTNGTVTLSLFPTYDYRVEIVAEAPYPATSIMVTNLAGGGQTSDVSLDAARVLLVNDDVTGDNAVYFEDMLEANNTTFHKWSVAESGVPDATVFSRFANPKITIWYTGDADTDVLDATEQTNLSNYLSSGGRLLLSGQNIAQTSATGDLFTNFLDVGYDGQFNAPPARGVAGDILADGQLYLISGGPNNQTSKDVLSVGTTPVVSINYGTGGANGVAMVRVEDGLIGWRAVFAGFGFEAIRNNNGERDVLLGNILTYFEGVVGIDDQPISNIVPNRFALKNNYPNPFNPETKIRFNIPQVAKVKLIIFNSLGQEVRRLAERAFSAGEYELTWDGRDDSGNPAPSGLYFYRMTTSTGFDAVQRMTLVK